MNPIDSISILTGLGASAADTELRHGIHAVRQYIIDNWPRCFTKDEPGKGFDGVDLPYPYAAPCIKGEGHFTFFFYWDTYFANIVFWFSVNWKNWFDELRSGRVGFCV